MAMTVKNRADALGTFRYVEVRLMEITSGWTPTTPEMEVKVMFGRHIWEHAQAADAIGKRTFELRQPEHYTLRPSDGYASVIEEAAGASATAERITALYDIVIPGLIARYRSYLAGTDALLDAPSVVIIDRIIAVHERQLADAHGVREGMSIEAASMPALRERESAAMEIVA
jgi:hypothetical protein